MKKIFIVVAIIIISCLLTNQNSNAVGTWTPQNSGVTESDFWDIDFVDALNGWCVGTDLYILHTNDGGQNWSIQNSGNTMAPDFLCLEMVNADTGFTAGFFGWIYRTTDGGTNWIGSQVIPGTCLYGIHFYDTKLGWAVGGNMLYAPPYTLWQKILRTTNGGDSWTVVWSDSSASANTAEFYDVDFADSLNGVVVGYHGQIMTSANGGVNWTKRSSGKTRDLYALDHVQNSTYVAVGDTGLVLKTTNGGVVWDTCARDSVGSFWAIDFADTNSGWLLKNPLTGPPKGTILNTNDMSNWFFQYCCDSVYLLGLKFVNRFTGWACGWSGTIIKYYDPDGVEQNNLDNEATHIPQIIINASPNPFHNNITIKSSLPGNLAYTAAIYDIAGREIKALPVDKLRATENRINWDGSDMNGKKVASGVYLFRLKQGGNNYSIKIIKLK